MSTQHDDPRRSVRVERTSLGRYVATNRRGGTICLGTGDDPSFTPVELLLAAIAGCSMVDVDHITSRRAEPLVLVTESAGDKVTVDGAGQMQDLTITWHVSYPAGPEGDEARMVLPEAIRMSHDRLCTVGRTVERGTPIANIEGQPGDDASLA